MLPETGTEGGRQRDRAEAGDNREDEERRAVNRV